MKCYLWVAQLLTQYTKYIPKIQKYQTISYVWTLIVYCTLCTSRTNAACYSNNRAKLKCIHNLKFQASVEWWKKSTEKQKGKERENLAITLNWHHSNNTFSTFNIEYNTIHWFYTRCTCMIHSAIPNSLSNRPWHIPNEGHSLHHHSCICIPILYLKNDKSGMKIIWYLWLLTL